jgi:hypothetical protein
MRKIVSSIPDGSLRFFMALPMRSHYVLQVDSESNIKRVPGSFPVGKDGRCIELTISPPLCASNSSSPRDLSRSLYG